MKKRTREFLLFILVVVIIAGAISGITNYKEKDTSSVSKLSWSVGTINVATGQNEECKTSIYTKDLIACKGLNISPDFEANGTYRIFYYAIDETYLGASQEYEATVKYNDIPEEYIWASFCRIVITPSSLALEDNKISFYEVYKYVCYDITVDKSQKSDNLLAISRKGYEWSKEPSETPVYDEEGSHSCAKLIDVSGYSKLLFRFDARSEELGFIIRVFDTEQTGQQDYLLVAKVTASNGSATFTSEHEDEKKFTYTDSVIGSCVYLEFTVPDNATNLAFTYRIENDINNYTLIGVE